MPARTPAHRALGEAVRSLRHERQLSQEALGLEAGLDRTYVGGVERGERNPSYTILLKLARALKVPASEILLEAERHGP